MTPALILKREDISPLFQVASRRGVGPDGARSKTGVIL